MLEKLNCGSVLLWHGDNLAFLAQLPPDSVDACVTDPPYGLNFMGKAWDHGVPSYHVWQQVLRVLKPGAHVLTFGGTRTYHRMACAIEDAGFEIRDCIQWLYGSGFPKSLDVSKVIDRTAGAERTIIETRKYQDIRNGHGRGLGDGINAAEREGPEYLMHAITAPATDAAKQWEGWGTALKPACEPIVLARKPLSESTIAANVIKWGVGALNIDGCRVEGAMDGVWGTSNATCAPTFNASPNRHDFRSAPHKHGRWPANVIHDGSEEVLSAFPQAVGQIATSRFDATTKTNAIYGKMRHNSEPQEPRGDSGSAARFFYCAKANKKERLGSKHPTVKPVKLMAYLVKLITPPNGVVLDPFAGTGTTGQAALQEKRRAILIEQESAYCVDIRARIQNAAIV